MQKTTSKKQLPGYLVLTIIAVAAALLLGLTNAVTAGPIEQHRIEALNAAYNAVMPAADYCEVTIPNGYKASGLYEALDEGGNVIGYCVTAASRGYAGDVAMTFGVDLNGLVKGCVVGDTSFAETDGFGARAKEDAFKEQFLDMDAVNGGSFLPLSGATFTSNAVLEATNEALRAVADLALGKKVDPNGVISFGEKVAVKADASALVPGASLKGEAEGYGGQNVIVKIKLGDDATIASIKVDASTQTAGIGQRCQGEDFTAQFIGKSIPVDGIDVLSNATITSNAVIEAVNGAQPSDEEEPAEEAVTVLTEKDGVTLGVTESGKLVVTGAKTPVTVTLSMDGDKVVGAEFHEEAVAASAPADAAYAGSAEGFASKVEVSVTVNPDGTVASVVVKADGETPGLGQACMEEAFTKQFIGKNAPFTVGKNIDAVSGATITSEAVAKAVNIAVASAPAIEPAPGVASAPVGEQVRAFGEGFMGEVEVLVTLNEDGTVSALVVKTGGETPDLGGKCMEEAFTSQFIGKAGPFTVGENIDAETGATITSKAVVEAVNKVAAAKPAPAVTGKNVAAEKTSIKQGFVSDVTAIVTLNADNTIATLVVKADGETDGLGKECMKESFTKQFIGKAAPFTVGKNIDAVSGATITSKAVCDAVNQIFTAIDADAAEVKEYKALAEGFMGDIQVIVSVNADGTIAKLVVKAGGETPELGGKCQDEAFTSQFIGKTAPVEGIDTIAGATITSKAVIEAVNKAVPAAPAADALVEKKAMAEGFMGDIQVIVSVKADGTIAKLVVKAGGETPELGGKCQDEAFTSQFIGKKAPVEGIDTISGATITSNAVIEAVNKALSK